MKVNGVLFAYNPGLLQDICTESTHSILTREVLVKDLNVGDFIKMTGKHQSCIVEVTSMHPKDVNGYYKLGIQLVKTLPGELDIEY